MPMYDHAINKIILYNVHLYPNQIVLSQSDYFQNTFYIYITLLNRWLSHLLSWWRPWSARIWDAGCLNGCAILYWLSAERSLSSSYKRVLRAASFAYSNRELPRSTSPVSVQWVLCSLSSRQSRKRRASEQETRFPSRLLTVFSNRVVRHSLCSTEWPVLTAWSSRTCLTRAVIVHLRLRL